MMESKRYNLGSGFRFYIINQMKHVVIVVVLLAVGRGDLPVHCMEKQIYGSWKLFVGESQIRGPGPLSCGHSIPDDPSTSYKAGQEEFRASYTMEVELKADGTVSQQSNPKTGSWTMIYDEGFEVSWNNHKFFAFSKYTPDNQSHCDQTLIGWFSNEAEGNRGCYRAEKKDRLEATTSLEQTSVVQPEFMKKEDLDRLAFVQVAQKQSKLTSDDHQQIVDRLNAIDGTWHARVYDHMVGKSFAELNRKAGTRKYFQGQTKKAKQFNSFLQVENYNNFAQQDLSDLPKAFSWKRYVFGYRGDFKNNIHQVGDGNKFIYPAGNTLVLYNSENKQQQILPTIGGTKGITCLTISPSKKYIAWSEDCEGGVIIVVYDMKTGKTKTLQTQDIKSRYYLSIDFARNPGEESKYLVALTGPPDQMIIYWAWDKAKCLGSIPVNNKSTGDNMRFQHIFYHMKEDEYVCVVGNGAIKPYKISSENPFKLRDSPFVKKENKDQTHSTNYLSYCILNDGKTMVVGTDQGELLYFNENNEFRALLPTSPFSGFAVECLTKYSNGFLVGGPDFTILIYRKHEGDLRNPYIRVDKKIQNKDIKARVVSMLLTGQDENLVIGIETGQIFVIPFSADRETLSEDNLKFDHLVVPFHTDQITGMDVCIRKPLIVTSSLDKSIRIWFSSSISLSQELQRALARAHERLRGRVLRRRLPPFRLPHHRRLQREDPHAQHLRKRPHPLQGNPHEVLQGDLLLPRRTPLRHGRRRHRPGLPVLHRRKPPELRLQGPSGQSHLHHLGPRRPRLLHRRHRRLRLLLETRGQPEQKSHLQSPRLRHRVKSVIFVGMDQCVYVSGVHQMQQQQQQQQQGNAEGGQKCIYEIKIPSKPNKERDALGESSKKQHNLEPFRIATGQQVAKMGITNSEKLFFFTTNEKDEPGALRLAKYPFTPEVYEIQSHFKGIARFRITFDDTYLFTAGVDGALIIYQVTDEQYKIKIDKDGMGHQFADEFLIQREKYKKKIQKIEKLKSEINDLQMKHEMRKMLQMKDRDESIRQLEEQTESLVKRENEKLEALNESKRKMEQNFEEQKRLKKQQHEQNKKTVEIEHKQKIALEQQRFEDLVKEKQKEYDKFNENITRLIQFHQAELLQKKTIFEEKLKQEKKLFSELCAEQELLDKNFTKERNDLEDKAEAEIDRMKEQNDAQLKILQGQHDKAEAEKTTKRTQLENESQKLEEQQSKLKEILEDIQQIQEANKQLTKERESHAKEIEERDKTIRDKGRRIYELKKKTQELEKFKFVLDYKIKELKRDIGPREEEIAKMKEQIANMNTEILHFKRTNNNLGLIVTDLNLRQKGMKKEIQTQTEEINKNNVYMKAFEYDISESYTCIDNFKKLKEAMLKLFNKYVQNESTKKKQLESQDLQKEFIKERVHLETAVQGLKEKFGKNLKVHEQDNNRIMIQNVDLISEINDLKREKKNLKDEIQRKMNEAKNKANQNQSEQVNENALDRELEENEEEIRQLQEKIERLSNHISQQKQGIV